MIKKLILLEILVYKYKNIVSIYDPFMLNGTIYRTLLQDIMNVIGGTTTTPGGDGDVKHKTRSKTTTQYGSETTDKYNDNYKYSDDDNYDDKYINYGNEYDSKYNNKYYATNMTTTVMVAPHLIIR